MMRHLALPLFILTLAFSCGDEDPDRNDDDHTATQASATTGSSAGGNESAGGAGGQGGTTVGTGGIPDCFRDACEQYGDRLSCCADPECGWHEGTGHQLFGVPPCVSRERVCAVANVETHTCPDGSTCLLQGVSQDTENDCTLARPGTGTLLPRGICVCR